MSKRSPRHWSMPRTGQALNWPRWSAATADRLPRARWLCGRSRNSALRLWNGQLAPPAAAVADPDPQSSTSDKFKSDKAWTNCSDPTQPGISPIVNYLNTLPYKPASNCEIGHYYMINNLSPGFLPNGVVDTAGVA